MERAGRSWEGDSVYRVLVNYAQSPGFNPQNCISQPWGCMPAIQTFSWLLMSLPSLHCPPSPTPRFTSCPGRC